MNKPFISSTHFDAYIPQLSYLDEYVAMLEDKKFIACYGVIFNREQALERINSDINHWEQHNFGPWMWYDKINHHYVGRAGLKTFNLDGKNEVELAYAINPGYWGKGVAVEISLIAIDFAFKKLNLESLICFTLTTNTQSLRVMEKLGFKYEKDFMHAGLAHKLYRLYFKNQTKINWSE